MCECRVWIRACILFFFFKQKTAYEMRISDWSSDVCSSDLCQERWRGGEIFGIGHEHAYPFLLGFCYCEAFSQSSTIANAAHYNPDDTHSLCGLSKYLRGSGSPLSRPLMLTRRETRRECTRGADRTSTRLNSSNYCAARM